VAKKGATKPPEKDATKEPKKQASHSELIKMAIEAFGAKIGEKNVSVGEFVRLMELEKELEANKPRDIKVTWVEPGETEPNEK